MSYFKLLGYNVSKKLTGSANSLFSTAVISGSSSAPNLKDMVPPHASAVAGKCPPIASDICPSIRRVSPIIDQTNQPIELTELLEAKLSNEKLNKIH